MNKAKSVKDRLKNKVKETGKTFQELLVVYGLERSIYRLSISRFADNFTLKGGIFLYAVYDRNYARATTDIDFLAQRITNNTEEIKSIFKEIFSMETDDPLVFDLTTLNAIPITEFKDYHGVNISIKGYLERTEIPVSIDIGFGDIIYPSKVRMEFPVVLSDDIPVINAYSMYSSVAEKFEAIVSLGYDNSRFKDYYDLYVIATTIDFDGLKLTEAVKETFNHRHTDISEIVAFEEGFADDPIRQSRWKSFIKKKKATLKISLQDAIDMMKLFVGPVANAISEDKLIDGAWIYDLREWRYMSDKTYSFAEVVEKAGLTAEDIMNAEDVDYEIEPL